MGASTSRSRGGVSFSPPARGKYSRALLSHPDLAWITNALGHRLPCVHIQRPGASITIIYSHRGDTDLGKIIPDLHDLANKVDVDVFAYEYSGYGLSTGTCSEEAFFADVESAFWYLTQACDKEASSIVLVGASLGTGPTVNLAARQQGIAGLVLISPMTSVWRTSSEILGVLCCCCDKFRNLSKIGQVECPVFIIHGTNDQVVPCQHGRQLHHNAPVPWAKPFWIEGAGHHDITVSWKAEFLERMAEFVRYIEVFELAKTT